MNKDEKVCYCFNVTVGDIEKAIKDEKAIYNTGIREGKELGREEGERRNKIEVIKRMLKDNIDIALIKKYADATDEEIDEAKANK